MKTHCTLHLNLVACAQAPCIGVKFLGWFLQPKMPNAVTANKGRRCIQKQKWFRGLWLMRHENYYCGFSSKKEARFSSSFFQALAFPSFF